MPTPLAVYDGKRVLIVGHAGALTAEVRRRFEQFGATLLGPISSFEEVVDIVATRKPDAAIVDLNMRAGLAVWFDDLLKENGIPYVFAQTGMPANNAKAPGFYLVNDDAQLAAIATALFPALALN